MRLRAATGLCAAFPAPTPTSGNPATDSESEHPLLRRADPAPVSRRRRQRSRGSAARRRDRRTPAGQGPGSQDPYAGPPHPGFGRPGAAASGRPPRRGPGGPDDRGTDSPLGSPRERDPPGRGAIAQASGARRRAGRGAATLVRRAQWAARPPRRRPAPCDRHPRGEAHHEQVTSPRQVGEQSRAASRRRRTRAGTAAAPSVPPRPAPIRRAVDQHAHSQPAAAAEPPAARRERPVRQGGLRRSLPPADCPGPPPRLGPVRRPDQQRDREHQHRKPSGIGRHRSGRSTDVGTRPLRRAPASPRRRGAPDRCRSSSARPGVGATPLPIASPSTGARPGAARSPAVRVAAAARWCR